MVASPILAILFQLAGSLAQQPAVSESIVITNVTLIDATGAPPQAGMTLTIRDGRIVAIGKSASSAAKVTHAVDGRGKFVIPGLWDMHVHLSWTTPSALPVLTANGVTSVRDMGGHLTQIDDWRTKVAAGLLTGPRILRAGPTLNGQQFNPIQMVVGTPEETRGVVRTLKQVGVDFLKVHRRMPRDSYFALMEEAKKQGLAVAGHIPMTVTPEEASNAGQASLEHTETLFEGTFSAGLKEGELFDAIRRFRADGADTLFARFVQNRTVVTPTLVAYRSIIESMDGSAASDPRRRYVAVSMKKAAEKQEKAVTAQELAGWKSMFAELTEVVRQMHRAGVALMAGTDVAASRIPGFTLHDELALLVEAGLTPYQALEAATRTPAMRMGKAADIGTLETGKIADLVLLDANPLEDIRNTQRISAVILGGKLLRRPDLDLLLRQSKEMASRN